MTFLRTGKPALCVNNSDGVNTVASIAAGFTGSDADCNNYDPVRKLRICTLATGMHARGATTIGNVFITQFSWDQVKSDTKLLDHESFRSKQWAKWGRDFGRMYEVEELRRIKAGLPPGCNIYEQEAGSEDGHYDPCQHK